MDIDGKLVISVKEARKLLGKECDKMSDEQIEDTIILLDEIARASIRQSIERIRNGEDYNKTIMESRSKNADADKTR